MGYAYQKKDSPLHQLSARIDYLVQRFEQVEQVNSDLVKETAELKAQINGLRAQLKGRPATKAKTTAKGKKKPTSVNSEQSRQALVRLKEEGFPYSLVAKRVGLSNGYVSGIANGHRTYVSLKVHDLLVGFKNENCR